MASEMRRAAQALVESHPQDFRNEYSVDEAASILARQLAEGTLGEGYSGEATRQRVIIRRADGDTTFEGAWKTAEEGSILEGAFPPPRGTQRLLQALALGLALLFGMTAWAFLSGQESPVKVSAAVFTALVVLAFPYVILGLSSQRSGREAALARRIQRALQR
jgi:hypothetical protein